MFRLAEGGRIDRSAPLRFTFDGQKMTGYRGDTLASALMAGGVAVVGRSFKYHRPRGVVGAGEDEPNAIVQLGEGAYSEPNLRATRVELYDGLVASSVNRWPSLRHDVGALTELAHRFLPAGFYYKTFMGGPGWMFWEKLIRRAAGLGHAPTAADPDAYLKRNVHCDVLVVGGGAAGLAAARAAVAGGGRVILVDDQTELGGALLWCTATIDGRPALQWVAETERALAGSGALLLRRTTVLGYYDHNHLVAVERVADHLPPDLRGDLPRQRLWQIRAGRVILATGALERPLTFPDNDRPGILLASAAHQYLNRYAVAPKQRVVLFTNNNSAYRTAGALLAAGVEIAAVIDTRESPGAVGEPLSTSRVPVHARSAITAVKGSRRVRAVRVGAVGSDGATWIDCDTVLMSGGWNPTVHLFSQSGGRLRWDEDLACFCPDVSVQAEVSVGGAAGRLNLESCLGDGHAAGAGGLTLPFGPPATAEEAPLAIEGYWRTPVSRRGVRQWVDFQSDVTDQDIALAARENFVSVEHFKRYTTTGMSTDQGKLGNVNALALLGHVSGRKPPEVGTTRFRPPYAPVAMSAIAAGALGDLHASRRRVPADAAHRELNACFEDFGGWQRPEYYPQGSETLDEAARREHRAVREAVGLFEGSPIGKVEVSGPDAAIFLHRIYHNSIADIGVGRVRYGLMLNENGVIIDDGVCARLKPNLFLVSPTSGAAARVTAWLEEWRQCEYLDLDVQIADVTTAWAALAVAGPRAREVLARLETDIDLSASTFPHMAVRDGSLEGVPARILRVSFSGELQYEVQVPASYGDSLWRRLLQVGAPFGITPVGIEAWLRLRIEKGYLHIGTDTDGTTIPDDVGLGGALKKKTDDFVGRRSLTRLACVRADREQLVGLRDPHPAGVLPVGACAFAGERFAPPVQKQGRVTSSCYSPTLDAPVALAMIKGGRARMGERLSLWSNGDLWTAEICSSVAYDPEGKRLRV